MKMATMVSYTIVRNYNNNNVNEFNIIKSENKGLNPNFVTGYVDGDGNFSIRLRKDSSPSFRHIIKSGKQNINLEFFIRSLPGAGRRCVTLLHSGPEGGGIYRGAGTLQNFSSTPPRPAPRAGTHPASVDNFKLNPL